MAKEPTLTDDNFLTVVPVPYEMLTATQRAYIDWKALGGIITDDTGPHKITLDELGQMLNPDHPVLKQTIAGSCRNVPNFWDLITERRKYFGGSSRLAYMHDKWYVAAATMKNWAVTEAWLINHDETYKTPKVKVEHEAGNSWAALAANLQKRKNQTLIDGEVVDGSTSNNT